MPYRALKHNVEYLTGSVAAMISSAAIGRALETAVVGIVSLVVGIITIVITHFVKKWLNENHPIE